MKLLRRIAIAMLAVCALSGTALLTGCGEGSLMDDAGDMVSNVVSDVTSGFSDLMSDVLPEPSSAVIDENSTIVSESLDPFSAETAAVAGNYRNAYYVGHEDMPFIELFEQNAKRMLTSEYSAENLTVEWQEGWTGNGEHAPEENTRLRERQIPFTGCVIYDDSNGTETVYYLYMVYDPDENSVSVVRVYDGRDETSAVKDGEDAKTAVEKFLTMEQQTF